MPRRPHQTASPDSTPAAPATRRRATSEGSTPERATRVPATPSTPTNPDTTRIRDPKALSCLAHPLRVDIVSQLAALEAATASRLAEALDQPVALVSYHLHQLARYGFVTEAPELARDRRERWWRRSSRYFSYTASDFVGSPEGLLALSRVHEQMGRKLLEALDRFMVELPALEPAWIDAAGLNDDLLELRPETLEQLNRDLRAVVTRYRNAAAGAGAGDGAGPGEGGGEGRGRGEGGGGGPAEASGGEPGGRAGTGSEQVLVAWLCLPLRGLRR